MTAETFANICVGLAGGLYLAAAVGYWLSGSSLLGVAFLCYAVANGCLVGLAIKALGR
jgi:hypothetical protein